MKKIFCTKFILLLSLCILNTLIASTQTVKYFVSTTGSNTNNGQSATPFQTITKAITSAVNGDTIVVQPGTYRETIDMLGKNLVLTSNYMFTQDTNIIANTKLDLQDAGVNGGLYESVFNYNFKKLYGFTLYNSPKIAIGNIHNITIERCVFRNNGYGAALNNYLITLFASAAATGYSILKDCDIYSNSNNTLILNYDRNSVGHSSEVRNTKIHHNNLGSAFDGTAISLGDGPIDVINTTIYKNKFGYAINHIGNPNYITVKINFTTIANNIGKGVLIYPGSGTFRIVYSNSIIANNTGLPFTVNHSGNNIYSGSAINWRNNIIAGGYAGMSITNTNTAYVDLAYTNNYEGVPVFADTLTGNYTLSAQSLGAAMGKFNNALFVDTIKQDFSGQLRPLTATNGPDIGAIQNPNTIFASAAPLSLTVSRNAIGRNRLNWTSSNGSNTKTFKIYRATNGGSFSLLTTTTNQSYLDYALVNGTNYSYKITESSLSSSNTSALDTGLTNMFAFTGNTKDALNDLLQGTANAVTAVSDRLGNTNSAYSFNGSTSYIEYNDTVANVTTSNPYTISFWAKENVSGGQILGKYLNMDAGLSQFAVAPVRLLGNGTGYYDHTASPGSTWHHYGLILESGSGKTKVYKNGTLVSPTGTISYNANASSTKFVVGKLSGSPAGPFNGIIDDIRIYKGVIPDSRLKNIYAYESQYGYVNPTESDYSSTVSIAASIAVGKIYVDQATGNANNQGNSTSPFATINQALNVAISGDTIVVLPGTYRETLDLAGRNIVLTSNYMFNADTTIIANTKINLQDAGVNGGIFTTVDNYNFKKIFGFTLYNAPKIAVNYIRNTTIENCVFKGNGYGNSTDNNMIVLVGSSFSTGFSVLKNCDIYSNSNNTLIWNADRNSFAKSAQIINTKIHHNNLGSALDGNAVFVYGPIDIINTLIYKNKFGHAVYYGSNPNYAMVKMNFVTIANNTGNAVISSPSSGTNTAVISNSIFTDNTGYNFKVQYVGGLGNIYDGLRIQWRNNVIQGGYDNMTIINPDLVSPNAPYRTKAYVELTYLNNFEGRPIFVDSANGDYRLAPTSLGLSMGKYNAALNIDSVKNDIYNSARPITSDQGPDIGAVQQTISSISIATPTNLTSIQGAKGRVELSWISNTNFITKLFNVYKSTDGTNFTLIGGTNTLSYIDTSTVKDQLYTYKVAEIRNNYANISSLDTGLTSLMTYDPGAFDVLNANKFVNVVGATLDADRFNQANKAFSFSGMSNFIEYSSDIANLDQNNPQSISFWSRSRNAPSVSMPTNYITKTNNYDMASPSVGSSVNQFSLTTAAAKAEVNTSLSYSNTGALWNHYVFVLKTGSNNTKIYRNDTLLATGTLSYLADRTGNELKFVVGKSSQIPSGEFSGWIDDIRVYGKALSDVEVGNLYAYESQYGNTITLSAASSTTQITVVGRKHFVDKSTGSNSNTGTILSPFATIQYAINNAAEKDTIIISDHAYDELLTIPSNTSITIASKYILDKDSTHINAAILDGTNNNFSDIKITASSNFSMIGITVKKVKGKIAQMSNYDLTLKNVRLTELGHNSSNILSNSIVAKKVTIDSSAIFKNQFIEGIVTISDSLIFTNSKFYTNQGGLISNSTSGGNSTVLINKSLFIDNTRTQGNSSFGNYMTINAQRYSVAQSKFINNSYTVFGGSGAGYSRFINNLFLNNTKNIERNPQVTSNDSVILIHNSFIQNANPTSAVNIYNTPMPAGSSGYYPWTDMSFFPAGNWKGLFYNNIFYGNMDFSGPQNNNNQVGIFLTMKGNLFKTFPTFTGVDTTGSRNNNLFTKLTFIDTANYNFQFVDTSSYLGKGSLIEYPFVGDINGDARPGASVAAPEPGAFESPYSFAPPTNLSASIGNKKVQLSWQNSNAVNGTSYKIYRSTAAIPQYSVPNELATSSTIAYKDSASSLDYTRNQYYRVRTVSAAGGFSGFSNEIAILPDSVPTPGLINDSSIAKIASFTWTQGSPTTIQKYYIYRSEDAISYTKIDSATSIKKYTDTLPAFDKFYYYKITALKNSNIESDFSTSIKEVGHSTPVLLSPENSSAKLDSTATLRWNKVKYATKYVLQYTTDNNFVNDVVQSIVTDTFKTISNLQLGKIYNWRVRAMDSVHLSSWATPFTFKTLITKPVLSSIVSRNKQLVINWTSTDTANTKWFKLFKDTIANPIKLVDSFSNKITTYSDSVSNNIKYFYRLTAVGLTNLESDYSNELFGIALNTKPTAAKFTNKIVDSIGLNSYLKIKYSASASSDTDGSIVAYKWIVNDVALTSTDSVITYDFLIGNNILKLIVTDNDGASDTSSTSIKISSVVKQFAAGFLGGITAVGPNIIYTADTSFNSITGASIYKLNNNGEVSYPISVASKIFTTPSVSSDSSVFITNGSNLNGFGKTGAPLWSTIPLGGISYVTPTVDSLFNYIYLGVSNKNFFAIDYKTGKVAWNLIGDAPINSSAVITGNRRLVFTSELGTLYGYDITTKKEQTEPKWKNTIGEIITRAPAIDNKYHLYFGTDTGNVIKIALNDDGSVTKLWSSKIGSSIKTSPVIDAEGAIYIGNDDGDLVKIDSSTGKVIWTFSTGAAIKSTPSISEYGTIYVANMNGTVYAIKTDKTLRWKYQSDAPISSNLLYINSAVYVGSEGGKLISLYDNVIKNTVNTTLVAPSLGLLDNAVANQARVKQIYNTDTTLTIKEPIWGTFQGNYKRNGAQAIECPSLPIIRIPDCTIKSDSINIRTKSLLNNNWIINDSVYTSLKDTSIMVKATDKVQLRATNIFGCVVKSSLTEILDGSKMAIPTIVSSNTKNIFCEGDSLTLSTSTAATKFNWLKSNLAVGAGTKVTIKESGIYTLETTNQFGCKNISAKIDISKINTPATPVLSRDANGNLIAPTTFNLVWYKDAQLLSDTSKFIKPTTNGIYTVKASNNGCLSALSSSYFYLVTDIINLDNNQFIKVTPNPFVHFLNIDFKVSPYQYLNLEFFDMITGQRVMIKERVIPGSRINVESLVSGTYIVRVVSSDYKLMHQFKLIKM
jgi:hypothetical protein